MVGDSFPSAGRHRCEATAGADGGLISVDLDGHPLASFLVLSIFLIAAMPLRAVARGFSNDRDVSPRMVKGRPCCGWPSGWLRWCRAARPGGGLRRRGCVLTELRGVFAAQRARRAPPPARLVPGMSCSARVGTAESGHLMPNRSPTSSSVL